MRIGIRIQAYARFGEEKFKKARAHGYDAVDYGMMDTETPLYTCSDAELKQQMARERALAEEAGILISQTHGPWRWPTQDGTAEDRAERMEKMKRSILATHLLGCSNWVVHPLMPWFLSFAAGAMLYVSVHELIPRSQGRTGAFSFIGGFLLMMVLDVALG